jgi:TRAP-type C4-dicarboxylate transport system substrate-binding protein
MKKNSSPLIMVVLGAFILFGLTWGADVRPAQAADTIELTYGGLWPPVHPQSKGVAEWIKKIEQDTNGRVKIKAFWAGALYRPRQSALELGKGVADIGDFSGAYAPKGFAFEKSMRMMFWGVNDRHLARKVYYEVSAKYPELEKEFTDANIQVMAYASIPPYQIQSAKKPIRTTSDFKGMTFKASGDVAKVPKAFGGEGIVMPMSESYTALQKGTIDGVFAPFETLKSFRFYEVVKYAVEVNIASAPAGHWGFCMDSWKKLPKDIQKVFMDNREFLGQSVEKHLFETEIAAVTLAKKNGVEFIKLAPAELEKVYEMVDNTVMAKMKSLDAKGLPGTAVYRDMRSLIKKYSK